MTTDVSLSDLLLALEWVSSAGQFEHEAVVSRATGKVHWQSESDELEEELPEDIEDDSLYIAVPHKNELDLGRTLALRYAEEHMPDSYDMVRGFFNKSGAYSRFKGALERAEKLDAWFAYEAAAIEEALRGWCEENGFKLRV